MSSTTHFAHPLASEAVLATWQGDVTATRADSDRAGERVFVTVGHGSVALILTPTEAADLAEALKIVSGMACSTRHAPYLARACRERLVRDGVSQVRASRQSGISAKRLRRFLRGELPITQAEFEALSEVSA